MNSYYVKVRVQEKKPVKLVCIENGRRVHVIMMYLTGYCQIMPFDDFNRALTNLEMVSDNETLREVRKELEEAYAFPLNAGV